MLISSPKLLPAHNLTRRLKSFLCIAVLLMLSVSASREDVLPEQEVLISDEHLHGEDQDPEALVFEDADSLVFEQVDANAVNDEATQKYRIDKEGLVIPDDGDSTVGEAERAKACKLGSQCLYELRFHLRSVAEKVKSAVEPIETFEYTPVTATYQILATPHMKMTSGGGTHASWNIEGRRLHTIEQFSPH